MTPSDSHSFGFPLLPQFLNYREKTFGTAIWNPILFINGLSKVILHCKLHRLKNNISRTHNFQSLLISVAGYGCENLSDAFHFQIKVTKVQSIFWFLDYVVGDGPVQVLLQPYKVFSFLIQANAIQAWFSIFSKF